MKILKPYLTKSSTNYSYKWSYISLYMQKKLVRFTQDEVSNNYFKNKVQPSHLSDYPLFLQELPTSKVFSKS